MSIKDTRMPSAIKTRKGLQKRILVLTLIDL